MTTDETPEAAPVLEVDALGKSYPRRGRDEPAYALRGLTLRARPGEAILLVGPNGAGKSTALRLIGGVETPSRGTVKVFGEPPRSMSNRRRIGYLPDASELFPFLNTAESLDFFGAAADLDRAERRRRAEEATRLLGLGAFGSKRVRTFSLGMKRRLGLACVLIGRPELLLLDEPIAGLDPEGMRLFLDIMRRERARGATLVFSSHHLGHAEELCDRIVVLKRGDPVLTGDVAALAAAVGALELTVAGLDDAAVARLRAEVESLGGTLERTRISEAGLEDYLLGEPGGERAP